MLAKTSVICSYEDVVYPVSSHQNAYKLIKDNQFDVVYPYGCGVSSRLSSGNFEEFIKEHDMSIIQPRCRTSLLPLGGLNSIVKMRFLVAYGMRIFSPGVPKIVSSISDIIN